MGLELNVLRCPDCKGPLATVPGGVECLRCRRLCAWSGGVVDLRPESLDWVKRREDSVLEELEPTDRQRPWRRLLSHPWALRFDYEIADLFEGERFLELGGESCYASAMYKSIFPDRIVYASDVSPNALRGVAIPTSRCFPERPDFFVAVDAENLPFGDGTIDSVFAQSLIHHLPRPVKMLNEVHRILRSGGRFVAVDAAIPRHFRFVFSRVARGRERRWGIQEALIPYAEWLTMIDQSDLPSSCLQIYRNPRYQRQPLFRMMGHVIRRLPESVARRLFPVGVLIVYQKGESQR